MKQVLEHGVKTINTYVTTCKHCRCKFTYQESDIRYGYPQHDPDEVKCPDCDRYTIADKNIYKKEEEKYGI